jgi:4-coumarate--CoA ligase
VDHQLNRVELEDLLLQHADVEDAAVIGVYDDEQATELPRAYSKSYKLRGMMHIQ